jgi:hypothetical protein
MPGKPASPIEQKKIIFSNEHSSEKKHKPLLPGAPFKPAGPGGPGRPTGPGMPI